MLLYNITFNLEAAIHSEWLDRMQREELPALLETGAFSSCRLCKLLDSPNEGLTYSLQCLCDSMDYYRRYKEEHAGSLAERHVQRFGNRLVLFDSLMEIIEEFPAEDNRRNGLKQAL